jgi:hypothetical protein
VLKLVTAIIGVFFEGARFADGRSISMMSFILPSTSPGVRLCKRLLLEISDGTRDFWEALRALVGWTQSKLQHGVTSMLTALGHAFLKLVDRVRSFPLMLGMLTCSEVPEPTKERISNQFFHCEAGCYEPGLARIVRQQNADPSALRSPSTLEWITNIFCSLPCHNIRNEDRLGRVRTWLGASNIL